MRSYKIYDNIEPHQIWREEISKSNYLPKFLSAYAFLFIINVPHKQKCDRVTYQKIKKNDTSKCTKSNHFLQSCSYILFVCIRRLVLKID